MPRNRLHREIKISFLLVLRARHSVASSQAIPDPNASDVPCGITLVGTSGGVADAYGEFVVILRTATYDPVPNAEIIIDFRNCVPDIHVASVQPMAGVVVDCAVAGPIIRLTTDSHGVARARIVGAASHHAAGDPGAGFKCAGFSSSGVDLGPLNIATYDQDGVGGVNPVDVSLWISDALSTRTIVGRSDFNCTNTINPVDLSRLLSASFGSGSLVSATNYCQ